MPVSELGKLILKTRECIGQTTDSFADAVGVTYSTIRNIEKGKTQSMKKKSLPRLAVALSLPLEEVARINRAAVIPNDIVGIIGAETTVATPHNPAKVEKHP